MKVLISGDSHVNGYAEAARHWPSKGITFEIRNIGPSFGFRVPFHDVVDNAVTFRHAVFYLEEFARRLPQIPLARHGAAYDWYGFSGPLGVMDIYADERLFSGRRLAVSRALYRQIVLDQVDAWLKFLAAAKGLGLAVFVIEAPAPFASSPVVDEMRRHADDGSILTCDRIARDIVKGELGKLGVPVAALPAHAFAPGGFMGERFRYPAASDPHHGNMTFSTMMLRCSARMLRQSQAWGAMADEQQPTRVVEAEDGDPSVAADYFRRPAEAEGKWIVEPGALACGRAAPSWITAEPAGSFEGLNGLRLARARPGKTRPDETDGFALDLPEAVRLAAGSRRIGLSVLARSASQERNTRFALAVSVPGAWTTGWCWFSCGRQVSGQLFTFDLPEFDRAALLRLEIKPDDGRAARGAPSEVFAVGIELLHSGAVKAGRVSDARSAPAGQTLPRRP